MIVGVGLDIVDAARWARLVAGIESEIFTPAELRTCADRIDRVDALAARFAAKEACLKALNAGIRDGGLRQIEIVSDASRAPQLRFTGALAARARARRVRSAHVSLSHQGGIAAAVVILEGTRKRSRRDGPLALETVATGRW